MSKLMNRNNPFLSDKVADRLEQNPMSLAGSERMTAAGAVNKTLILFMILIVTTLVSYQLASPIITIGGAIAGLVVVLVASFKPERSTWAAPVYAGLEGLFVGGVTYMYAMAYQGIVFKAVMLTFAVLFMMLFLYKAQIIKVTAKFRSGVIMATGAIFLVYMINFVLGFFGMNVPFLHDGGIMGIGISLLIIAVASMNLLLDFDFIEKGEQEGYPKYMEWFGAMGLIVTLVWLYIEMLRLLSKLSRD